MIRNFGRNVAFRPAHEYSPRTEQEVLEILGRHRQASIRAFGRLHAWSEAARCDEVLVDLRHINHVTVQQRPEGLWATVGAGCQIKRLLSELERQAGATTPSLGLITEQTIAGATATGTHGSGKHSLSHYLAEVRIATYDCVTGEPVIRTIAEGPELLAARCSLGCLGIVLSVGFWCRPQYQVEESIQRHDCLEDVIAAEAVTPLQQFFLIPWSWTFYAQHRREVEQPRSRLATLYRLYCFCNLDVGLHLAIMGLSRIWRSRWAIRTFFRRVLPLTVVQRWRVTDKSQSMLVMEHELFRHIEIEVFVRRSRLSAAIDYTRDFLRHCAGEVEAIDDSIRDRLVQSGLWESLAKVHGVYTHCYPICVRKVLPDETLISMAGNSEEPCYAISLISYEWPSQRAGFFQMADGLSTTMAALFEGRPHWGKVCPIDATQAAALYPRLQEFRDICRRFDRDGVFRNRWVNDVIFQDPS